MIDRKQARGYLTSFDFRRLFLDQLGWDKPGKDSLKEVGGIRYPFKAIAEKRGVAAFHCPAIPDYGIRLKLDKLIAKDHFQHLLVFGDPAGGRQIWQWMRKEEGRPYTIRTFSYSVGQPGELLFQKLDQLAFSIEEEDALRHGHVVSRMDDIARVEKLTKKFYERFKTEHDRFRKFVEGIPDKQMEAWYVSVMINRLMFLYFIQAKSFLNGDQDYLLNKLKESRNRKKGGYYRDFLCPLFFEGFARKKEERSAAVNKLLGSIPYLNGGLFQRHQIEELRGKEIQIADTAFEHIFSFFREYSWHLDERESRDDHEINPDVLGYIFEKYINQKQMGAYYTKEDITEYISKNTILPFLLGAARKDCAVAFDKTAGVWRLLRDEPDRYIYAALRHGADLKLPPEIAAGVSAVDKRTEWNKTAPSEYALPTELWREVVDRRRRCEELRRKLAAGEVAAVNDLVTLNLDIRQFAQDVIQYCEGPELLHELYKTISKVSVLDPTCGSGAFLFAALNILKPMYEACLQRMQLFVDELDAGPAHHPKKFEHFRQILEESRQHPKQDYFILKSIIVNNLYGVDIMEEAVEICKLRLFLKLIAQVESKDQIEPLPDIDFNIRAGNTLVGYTRIAEIGGGQGNLLLEEQRKTVEDKAKKLASDVHLFRLQQTKLNGLVTIEDKLELRRKFAELEDELDDFLAAALGVKKAAVAAWKQNQKPFHWLVDFHRIMDGGGFDVIIGNPPYVELSKLRNEYQLRNYVTIACGNLYCPVIERGISLSAGRSWLGMIIPMSFSCTERMTEVRDVLAATCSDLWVSHFSGDAHPAMLFDGVKFRLDIVVGKMGKGERIRSTGYLKWFTEARGQLFSMLRYDSVSPDDCYLTLIPKTGRSIATSILRKLLRHQPLRLQMANTNHRVYVHRVITMFVKCFDFVPFFSNEVDGVKKSEDYKPFTFQESRTARLALGLLNSTTFFFYFIAFGDCFHCGKDFVEAFPAGLDKMQPSISGKVITLATRLISDMKKNSVRKVAQSKATGRVEYDEFWPRHSKSIIDEIDTALAPHFGFTAEELDFIINFDIKYRLGAADHEE